MQRTEPPLFVQFRLNTNMSSSTQSYSQSNKQLNPPQTPTESSRNIIYGANRKLVLFAQMKHQNKQTNFSSCDYSSFAASRSAQISAVSSLAIVSSSSSSPPSRGGHSAPLSSPPVVMATEGVCLSAGRRSEQCYSTTGNTSRLIYSERSCH